jgi:hypothetical protein
VDYKDRTTGTQTKRVLLGSLSFLGFVVAPSL